MGCYARDVKADTDTAGVHSRTAMTGEGAEVLGRLALALANTPDKQFIEKLVSELAVALDLDCVLVGRLSKYSNMIRTVSMWHDGTIVPNIVYSLSDTPCERVLEGDISVYPDGVAEMFPKDKMLSDMGVRGYVGAPLVTESGNPIGILVGVKTNKIDHPDLCSIVINFFRNRVAHQLVASTLLDQYMMAFSYSREGFWGWDIQTGDMVLSKTIEKVLRFPPEKSPKDISGLEALIHPEDRSGFKSFINECLKADREIERDFRMRCGDGEYHSIRYRVRQVFDEQGKISSLIGSIVNLSQ